MVRKEFRHRSQSMLIFTISQLGFMVVRELASVGLAVCMEKLRAALQSLNFKLWCLGQTSQSHVFERVPMLIVPSFFPFIVEWLPRVHVGTYSSRQLEREGAIQKGTRLITRNVSQKICMSRILH